ncbi:MAG TPA: C39 family peptidase [Gemmatimonadaceae bacterium]|nr:C39 family peptidase [Gemmatimonadaceae bacterium]
MSEPIRQPIRRGVIRIPLPDTIQQTDYSCGAACLQAVCRYYGVGGEDEWEFVKALRMDKRTGSHPFQIARAAKAYGLRVLECPEMTIAELKASIVRRRPVLLMIQAWGEKAGASKYRSSYDNVWVDGHWVVAIGFDKQGIFFEDPSLEAARGFLTYEELARRWHDVGPRGRQMRNYGMIMWRAKPTAKGYTLAAKRIP